jgi:hypothetical protein
MSTKDLSKKVKKAIKAANEEANPSDGLSYKPSKKGDISVKTADIVASRTRGGAKVIEKVNAALWNSPRKLTPAETKVAKVVQARRNVDLGKTAARGKAILKTQKKKEAKANAKKAIGG